MEGYEVVTTEDEKVGKVVGTHGDHLIVEQGTIRKSKHALPRTFAEVNDGEQVVRMSVSKNIFCDSPKIDGEVDETAIAEHYGLAGGSEAPPMGSELQAERAGITPAPEERAKTREQLGGETDQGVPAESPALLGDRYEHTRKK
jgi:hypothetical protein